jgi:hypothetical protein
MIEVEKIQTTAKEKKARRERTRWAGTASSSCTGRNATSSYPALLVAFLIHLEEELEML